MSDYFQKIQEKVANLEDINPKTTRFILATMGFQLLGSIISAIIGVGYISAVVVTFTTLIILLLYFIKGNKLIHKLMLFSLVAGFVELFGDHWAVSTIEALVYPGDEFRFMSSPFYMPFSWVLVLTQLGYLCLLLLRGQGILRAMLIIAVAGALYIPFYEEMAKHADWWFYQNTDMIFNTPYFVILSEGLLALFLPPLLGITSDKQLYIVVLLGVVQGIWLNLSAVIAYWLVG